MDQLAEAEREIVEIHEFFVDWISGRADETEARFEEGLMRRLDDDFLYVMPGGARLGREDLRGGMFPAHGSNPDFRIAIRNVQIRLAAEDVVVALYEEWQKNAKASKPADNGRLSTVVFRRKGEGLSWTHLHETWMTPEAMAAGDYDF